MKLNVKSKTHVIANGKIYELGIYTVNFNSNYFNTYFGHSNGQSKISPKKTMTNSLEKSTDHKIN